jgi:hypothetical protein
MLVHDIFQTAQEALELICTRLVGFEEIAPVLPCFPLFHLLLVLLAFLILRPIHVVANIS